MKSMSKLIVSIVAKGMGSKIVPAAKGAGARGGTIFLARGTAQREIYETILGITFEPEKELVLVATEAETLEDVLAVITETGRLNKPGRGVAFVLDLANIRGVAQSRSMV